MNRDLIQQILNLSGSYFNSPPDKIKSDVVDDFISNNEINTMLAYKDLQNTIQLTLTLSDVNEDCLVFYKKNKTGGNLNHIRQIGVITIEGGIIKSIFDSLTKVFSPYITKDTDSDEELKGILNNLQLKLSKTLGLPKSKIQSVYDEVCFWSELNINITPKHDKERSKQFIKLFEELNDNIREFKLEKIEFNDFLDTVYNILDEIWRQPFNYPQNRICDIIEIISVEIIDVCNKQITCNDVWLDSTIYAENIVSRINDTVSSWLQNCDTLTRLYWPNFLSHQWVGEPYVPRTMVLLNDRLNQIMELKCFYKQLCVIDPNISEFQDILQKEFIDINIFDITLFGQKKWSAIMEKLNSIFNLRCQEIALILKELLKKFLNSPRQVIFFFIKHDPMMKRSNLKLILSKEREYLLRSIKKILADIKECLKRPIDQKLSQGNLSVVCWECNCYKILQYQLIQITKILHLIDDLNGYDVISTELQKLNDDCENMLQAAYETWTNQSIDAFQYDNLRIKIDDPVVRFNTGENQFMVVTFNPKLVIFCNDIKTLESLGYRIPISLREEAKRSLKFISQARLLQQIATFHNTVGDRIIPCQRPILLKNAIELSNLVESHSAVWNDDNAVRCYIEKLQSSVRQLSRDNNFLLGIHEQLKTITMKLKEIDLMDKPQIWKDELRRIRNIFVSMEEKGFTNLDAFKMHWDHQIYKILECNYITGMAYINQKLPPIKVDLIFRNQELQFNPSIEDLGFTYYKNLKYFINLPKKYRSLTGQNNAIFEQMIIRNHDLYPNLFEKASKLFKNLILFRDAWLPWVNLGYFNIEEICSSHLIQSQDWDRNFRSCKFYSQQIAKITNMSERLGCFIINVTSLRNDIESISRRYWDALALSLKTSIIDDVSIIQEFVSSSFQLIHTFSINQNIAETTSKYEYIIKNLPKMHSKLETINEKDYCLAGWCKERINSIQILEIQWSKLNELIQSQNVMIQRQLEIMYNNIDIQIKYLCGKLDKFKLDWESVVKKINSDDNCMLDDLYKHIEFWDDIIKEKDQLCVNCLSYNVEFPLSAQELFIEIENDVAKFKEQWSIYKNYTEELENILQENWLIYQQHPYVLSNTIAKWKHMELDNNAAARRIKKNIDIIHDTLNVLKVLQSNAITDSHWHQIFKLLNIPPKQVKEIKVIDITSNISDIVENYENIQLIVKEAHFEEIVKNSLAELEQWGNTACLKLFPHRTSVGNDIMLIKEFQDTINKLSENQSLLQTAKNSTSLSILSDQVKIWESRMVDAELIINLLSDIQRRWLYLEPIYRAGTLHTEESIFRRIDDDFKHIMKQISQNPRILIVIKISKITKILNTIENQLTKCQHALSSYIAEKREIFSRFYFLADDDMLELLGQTDNVDIIQKHITKLFPGIEKLDFVFGTNDHNDIKIKSIYSAEKDELILKQQVDIKEVPVEVWLNTFEKQVEITLKLNMKQCYDELLNNQFMIEKYPSQILSTIRAIKFTSDTERAIKSMKLSDLLQTLKIEISERCKLLETSEVPLVQLKLRCLLIDLIHFMDIIELLIENNTTSYNQWHWLKQLKFYMKPDGIVNVKIGYANFDYSYEFLGNPNKLVHTQLTDNTYFTLSQAMLLGLGGNPIGPAGTGKTECIKSFGSFLGRLVLVFNCDENIDTNMMGLILTGLAQCGAWGCFDEFNRLDENTLSTVSMQIQPIQEAIKFKNPTVNIMNKNISLNLNCGIFVTMNPADEEYGGRKILPGNLQAMFRPIIMYYPQPKDIAAVLLFVEGYKYGSEIASCIVELFSLAKQILTAEGFYDWSLRELRTVITACGILLRNYNQDNRNTLETEKKISLQAIVLNITPKLNSVNIRKLNLLVDSIFPGTEIDNTPNQMILNSVNEAFGKLNITKNTSMLEKSIQLYDQLSKRMGVAIIGPPGSGKTTIIKLLKEALTLMDNKIKVYTISAKAQDKNHLFGSLDPNTQQWQNGILSSIATTAISDLNNVTSWIWFDGDIDPDWIETLNSVLDDNRLLTLPTGWRIKFGNNIRFLFETHNLKNASPATISRIGIINISEEDTVPSLYFDDWCRKQNDPNMQKKLFEQYFLPCFEVLKLSSQIFETTFSTVIRKSLLLINDCKTPEEFCISIINGVGCSLILQDRLKLIEKIFKLVGVSYSSEMDLSNCYYDDESNTINFYESDDINFKKDISSNIKIDDYIVKRPPTKLYTRFLHNILENKLSLPFLIVGKSGQGKSNILRNAVKSIPGYEIITICCNAQLITDYVVNVLKQNCLVVADINGRTLKCRQQRLVLYFRNIDLCTVDKWGTSQIYEFILQLINHEGFYTENLEWCSIKGIQICASYSKQPKQMLPPRLSSIFIILNINDITEEDMEAIFKTQLDILTMNLSDYDINFIYELPRFLVEVIKMLNKNFTSSIRCHYNFPMKMITNVIKELCHYTPEYWRYALVNELVYIFSKRLVTLDEEHIFSNNINALLPINYKNDVSMETYFIPTDDNKTTSYINVDKTNFHEMVQQAIATCAIEEKLIDFPIVNDSLNIIANLCRIFKKNEWNLVLVTQNDLLLRDAINIASTIINMDIKTIQSNENYNIQDFSNDLKHAMQTCTIDNHKQIFVIKHSWLSVMPEILNIVEAYIESSIVPMLSNEELEIVANSLRNTALSEGYQDSLSSYFIKRLRYNFHFIIILHESETQVNDLFRKYRCLYESVDFIWMKNISKKSIQELPELYRNFKSCPLTIPIPKYFHAINNSSFIEKYLPENRYNYLIQCYFNIYETLLRSSSSKKNSFMSGVNKLTDAYDVVNNLRKKANESELDLEKKRSLAKKTLDMITYTMKNATTQRTDLINLQRITQEKSEKILERKNAIELELKEVEPILKAAVAAVGQIKTESLSEIRSLRAPPDIIRDILEGVLRLMGIRDTSWNSMKSFLAKRGLKEDIKCLDPSKISIENCMAVEKLLENKSSSFNEKVAKRASVAAAPLASWVIANVRYAKVAISIKPLEIEQNNLKLSLEQTEKQMESLTSGLANLEEQVNALSNDLNFHTQEAAVIELQLAETRKILNTAEDLVEKLNSEYHNWTTQLEKLNNNIAILDEKSFLLATCICYLTEYTSAERTYKMNDFIGSNELRPFNLLEYLVTDKEKVEWEHMGLSPDIQSKENAALLLKLISLPFGMAPIPHAIDPSGKVPQWLQNYLKNQNIPFDVCSQNSNKFFHSLELAVRFGKIFVITDCEKLSYSLFSLINHEFVFRFNKRCLFVGKKLIEIHENFNVVLTSNIDNNLTCPEVSVNISRLSFTTSILGYTDQLMIKCIQKARPELESKRLELLTEEADLLKKNEQLQYQLLYELSNADGDITKNDRLLITLNEIKDSSTQVQQTLDESNKIKSELLKEYDVYKDICTEAASFFIEINKIYNIPVTTYTSIFEEVIQRSVQSKKEIYQKLVQMIYSTMNRTIKKIDQHSLGLQICKSGYKGLILDTEWTLFITNFALSEKIDLRPPDWLRNEHITKIMSIWHIHPDLYNSLELEKKELWNDFYAGQTNEIPINLSAFEQILICQLFRPELSISYVETFIMKTIGSKNMFVEKPTISSLIPPLYDNAFSPIILITSSYVDPSKEILEYCNSCQPAIEYKEISIGKGLESTVLDLVNEAAINGNWICIKNAHLLANWMQKLDIELKKINPKVGFCIWIITEKIIDFPEAFILRSKVMLYEDSDIVKPILCKLVNQWSPLIKSLKNERVIKLIIVAITLHAVIQARRTYIPTGWVKHYEFNEADLKAAIDIILLVEQNTPNKFDWDIIQGLIQHVCYGGRIIQKIDTTVFSIHLQEFLNDNIFTKRWKPLNFDLMLPQSKELSDYEKAIAEMSDSVSCEQFGLSVSFNHLKNLTSYANLLKQLRSNNLKTISNDNFEKQIRSYVQLWKKISQDLEQLNELDNENYFKSIDPWKTFIHSEYELAITLYSVINNFFLSINNRIDNKFNDVTRSTELLLNIIAENKVPKNWRKIWSGPISLNDYLKKFKRCAEAAEQRNRIPFNDKEMNIDLSSVFRIDTFLAALKLINSKAQKIPAHRLKISSSLCKYNEMENCVRAVVKLIILEGAEMISNELILELTKQIGQKSVLKEIHLTYVKDDLKTDAIYIPLYSSASRSELIAEIPISSRLKSKNILMSGVALIIP